MSDYTESRNEQMIKAIINDTPYSSEYTQGRNEQILQSIIDNTPYTKEPESRMEELLIELKEKIEGGGGEYQAKSVMPDFSDGDVIITPDPEYSALSSVTVEKDTDLIAGNIKKDVEIFGVTGTYEMPADIETDMNAVLNKKMGTATTYAPNTWADTVNLMGKLPEKTASGAIASFNDGADDVPIVSGIFDIVAVQSGSGDPSPVNVRPISGFTGMNVTRASKNLLPFKNNIDFTISGVRFYTLNGNLYLDGTATASISSLSQEFKDNFNFKLKSTTYHFERNNEGYFSMYIKPINEDTNIISNSGTATLTSEVNAYLGLYIVLGKTFDNTLIPCQLELGETATTYEPYNATTYAVDWTTEAGTVYGGSLNATTGVLTVNRAGSKFSVLDFSTLSSPENHIFRSTYTDLLSDVLGVEHNYDLWSGITEKFTNKSYQNISGSDDGYFAISMPSTNRIVFIDQACSTVEQFVNAHGNDLLVYPLATPITYQLTPTQINTLLGVNNIYCDTGGTTVTYRADIDLLIGGLTP